MKATLTQQGIVAPPEVYITPFSRSGMGAHIAGIGEIAPNEGSGIANRALYHPIFIPRTVVATRMFAFNGNTTGTNNRDLGIYRSSGGLPTSQLVSSGGVLISGARLQYADITDTQLVGPALYFVAYVQNGATDTLYRASSPSAPHGFVLGFQQSSAYPLPATATPVAATGLNIPVFGITLRASP